MAYGAFSFDAVGSVTAPTVPAMTVGSALTAAWHDYGPADIIYLPSLHAALFCNGIDFQYHYLDGIQYLNGPRAPKTAVTVASTATRATAVFTFTGQPADGTTVRTGKQGVLGNSTAVFKTTLSAANPYDQVLIGANQDVTMQNWADFINMVGTNGSTWMSNRMNSFGYTTPAWDTENGITSSAIDTGANTITFRAISYGTAGNAYISTLVSGTNITDPATDLFTGGTAGTNSTPGLGTYVHSYAYVRSGDVAVTAAAPTTTTDSGANANLTVSSFTAAATRDGIDLYRVLRSTVNGGSLLYKVADTASDPYTDGATDATLVDTVLQYLYDPAIVRPYASGYGPRFRCACLFRGSLVAAGAVLAADYSTGTISSASAATLTLSATATPKADWIGRMFYASGDSQGYLIVDVTEASRVLTLNQTYNGATSGNYTVRDQRNPYEVYWTPPLLFNNWPVGNSETGITSPDPAGVVALVSAWDSVVALTRTGAYRLIGSPDSGFRVLPVGEGMGCFNASCVQMVDGVLYWIGADGIYAWSDGSMPESISQPPLSRALRGIKGTLDRLNLEVSANYVSDYNETTGLIRFFVALDDEPYNNYAIVCDTQTGGFMLDTCEAVTSAQTLQIAGGLYVTVVGDAYGNWWQLDTGEADGMFGTITERVVSSYTAGTRALTDTSGSLPTASGGLSGVPVYFKDSFGEVRKNVIVSNTATVLTLQYPQGTAPIALEEYLVAPIFVRIKSGKSDMGVPEERRMLSSITATFTPVTSGRLWCAASYDSNDPSLFNLRSTSAADYATLSLSDGEYRFAFRKGKGRRFQWEFFGFARGYDVGIVSYIPVLRGDREALV